MESERKRTMKLSIKEGASYAVSVGAGNNFVTPYALAFGATNFQVSMLSAIPNLFSSVIQMFTPKLMEKHDRKRIVVSSVFVQAAMWLPILLLSFFHGNISYILILLFTISTAMNAFISPAWRSWISDIIPESIRGKFFGLRSRIVIITQIVSMGIVGLLLDRFRAYNVMIGFAIAFLLAFFGRFVSGVLLTKHYEPHFKMSRERYFSFTQFMRKAPRNNFGRFALFIGLMTMSVYIAAPFFTVYMLKNLGFSYATYTALTVATYIGLTIGMGFWGKVSDEVGNKKVLEISSFFIGAFPLLWLLSGSPLYLGVLKAVNGFFWAGFNLSSFNFIFDAVTRERRGLCAAYTNALTGIGIFLGSSFGGVLTPLKSLAFIFVISGALRILMAALFVKGVREVRLNVKPMSLLYFIRKFP